jgi:hypothetical protein
MESRDLEHGEHEKRLQCKVNKAEHTIIIFICSLFDDSDRLCGLVVRVSVQIQRSWVRFPALPDFLRGSGSGTGSTQPREDN